MNKHNILSILKYFLLIAIALTSGCGPSTNTDSPTLIPMPSQVPTATLAPSPTSTPKITRPDGDLIYSTQNGIFSFNIQTEEVKVISTTDKRQDRSVVVNSSIYMLRDVSSNATQFEIFKANIDGSNLKQLTSDGNKFSFAVSPNQDYIAYSPEINQLFLYNLKSGKTQTIAEKKDYAFTIGSWSLDGKMLVYSETKLPLNTWGHNLVYSLASRSTTDLLPRNIGIEALGYESQPVWSPNGKQLVLNLVTDLQSGYPDVYVFNTENKSLQKIATNIDGESFAWSPNGDLILFESITNPNKLYLFNLNSKELNLIKEGEVHFPYYFPMWSPDGNYFAYFTNKSDTEWYLNVQNITAGTKIRLKFPSAVVSAQWIFQQ